MPDDAQTAGPIETVAGFYAALGRGDVPQVLGLLAPDLTWRETPRFPYATGAA